MRKCHTCVAGSVFFDPCGVRSKSSVQVKVPEEICTKASEDVYLNIQLCTGPMIYKTVAFSDLHRASLGTHMVTTSPVASAAAYESLNPTASTESKFECTESKFECLPTAAVTTASSVTPKAALPKTAPWLSPKTHYEPKTALLKTAYAVAVAGACDKPGSFQATDTAGELMRVRLLLKQVWSKPLSPIDPQHLIMHYITLNINT